jgi:hypothetical protein
MTSRSGSEKRRRNAVVQFRVDAAERALLEQAAKDQRISISELLRRSVFSNIGDVQTPESREQSARKSASLHRSRKNSNEQSI